jgi:hypothetical protein
MTNPAEELAPAEVVMDPEWSGNVATMVRRAIDAAMNESDRSKWAASNHLGVSDIGTCHEYVRRMILGVPWVDEQNTFTAAAFVGTAVGDHVEKAMAAAFGEAVQVQRKVTVRLRIRGYDLDLPGTADIIVHDDGLIDVKTKDGLGVVRRTGLTQQQVFQLVLYAAALVQEGVLDPENLMLACAFIDRSGREPDPYVFGFAYTDDLLQQAMDWIGDVIYAIEQGQEAYKDPPRSWCFATCPYASDCRGGDTDVEGLLLDPEVVEAARVYKEATATIAAAKKDQKSALSVLDGVQGSTGEWMVRWIDIGPSTFTVNRQASKRIDIRPVTGGKKK